MIGKPEVETALNGNELLPNALSTKDGKIIDWVPPNTGRASQNMDGYLAGFQLSPIYEQDSLQFFVDLQTLQNFHKLEPQQFLQKKLRRAYQQLMMKPLQIQDL